MSDLSECIRDFLLQVHQDAAQALADAPTDRDAGVIVTPVIVVEGRQIELDPLGFYRPAEVPGG